VLGVTHGRRRTGGRSDDDTLVLVGGKASTLRAF
jgi:hypothetical protein